MADDLSLLFKLRADNAQAKSALADTRAAIAQLRSTFGTEFSQIENAGSKAFASLTDNINLFVGQRIPLVGGAFVRVTENLRNFGVETGALEKKTENLAKTIGTLAKETNQTSGQITSFLSNFVRLGTQAERDTLAIEKFGAGVAQDLIPKLEKAGEELVSVTSASAAAGAGIAAFAGPIGIAVLALAALAAGSLVVIKQLFDLTKAAADYRGKMFDLSQQLGISTETLSAFEVLAQTTGGDIGSITASLGIFQKKLEEAQDPLSKTSKLFGELGVSTGDTEQALRDTLSRLAAMPEGFHQTATALELFGRGGKSILAILKEMHGDLDGAIDRFRQMGLIVSHEDAEAADKFNDELALLGFQFRSLLGKEGIPAATNALQILGRTLDDNRELITNVSQLIGLELRGAATVTAVSVGYLNVQLEATRSIVEPLAKALEAMFGATRKLPAFNTILATPLGGASGAISSAAAVAEAVKAGRAANEAAEKQIEDAQTLRKIGLSKSGDAAAKDLELQRHLTEQLRLEHERKGADLENFYKRQQQLVEDHLTTLQAQITKEREINSQAFAAGGIDQAEFDKTKRELDLRAQKAQNERDEATARLSLETQRALIASEVQLREQQADIDDARRAGELNRLKTALANHATTESDAISRELQLKQEASTQRIGIIEYEIKQEGVSAERLAELNKKKAISEQQWTDEKKRLTEERIDAANREAAETKAARQSVAPDRGVQPGFDAGLGLPPPPDTEPWEQAFSLIKEMGLDAVNSLAAGVANLTQQWVLYGSVGPGAVRKMVASVLAGLAAQAAMQAVMELAYGFIALTPWGAALYGPASNHFIAAALFASVAAGSAIAGRLVAGDSFTQKSGSVASGGGSSPANNTRPQTPTGQDTNRVSYQPAIEIHLHGDASQFDFKVIKAVVDSHRNNGEVRLMTETGQV